MLRKFAFWLPFFAAFFISYGIMYYDYALYGSENIIYIPLNKGKASVSNNRFYLDFKPIIPVNKAAMYKGKAVVYINSFKVASFVRFAEVGETAKDLSFGEQFLQYNIHRPTGLNESSPSLYFVQRFYQIPKSWKEEDLPLLDRARYAAYVTDKKTGKAVFLGLVDRNFSEIKPRSVRMI